jgi:hypothetical protein
VHHRDSVACLQVHQRRTRYEAGLQKLLAAEAEVATMKQELIDLQPKLIQTSKEVGGRAVAAVCAVACIYMSALSQQQHAGNM